MTSTNEIAALSEPEKEAALPDDPKQEKVSAEEKEEDLSEEDVVTDLRARFAHASQLRSTIARGSEGRISLAHASVRDYEELSKSFRMSFRGGGSSRLLSTRDIQKSLRDSDWFATGLQSRVKAKRNTMISNHAVSRVIDGKELMVTDQVLKLIPGEKDLQLRFYLTGSDSSRMEDAGMNICIDLQKPEGEYRPDFLTEWPLMKEYANGENEPTMLDLLPPTRLVGAKWISAEQTKATMKRVEEGDTGVSDTDFSTFGFAGVGRFIMPDDYDLSQSFRNISAMDMDEAYMKHFNIGVFPAGKWSPTFMWEVEGIVSVLEHTNTRGKFEYMEDFVLSPAAGGGAYFETHRYQHFFLPADLYSIARIVIGKKISEGVFDFITVIVPFGWCLVTGENVIHGSSGSSGRVAVAYSTNDRTADITICETKNNKPFDPYGVAAHFKEEQKEEKRGFKKLTTSLGKLFVKK